MTSNIIHTLPVTCWKCWRSLNGHTCVDSGKAEPRNYDISVCAHCAAVGIYEDGKIRPLTKLEMTALKTTKHWPTIEYIIEKINRRNSHG